MFPINKVENLKFEFPKIKTLDREENYNFQFSFLKKFCTL